MKKLLLIPILVLIISLILPIPAAAHTSDSPFATLLIAGQQWYAGEVQVWNDADFLHVTYTTTNYYPWTLEETHLAVADSLAGIPVNNKGNPKVGQFPYKGASSYSIPLSGDGYDWTTPGTELVIAAHAVVRVGCSEWEETAWGGQCIYPEFTEENGWATYFPYTIQ